MEESMTESTVKASLGAMKVEYRTDSPNSEPHTFSDCSELYRIIFVTRGEATVTLEGVELRLSEDTALLLLPLEYYSVTVTGDSSFERYTVSFYADSISGYSSELFYSLIDSGEGKNRSMVFDCKKITSEIISTLERGAVLEKLPQREKRAYLSSLIGELIIFLSATSGEPALTDDSDFAVRVMRYINGNIRGELSLDKISRYFFVSKYYLCRAFKNKFGTSVHEYITTKRIMLSRQLISAGETASAAAYKVGFGDYSSYYRAYRKVVGDVPAKLNQRRESK